MHQYLTKLAFLQILTGSIVDTRREDLQLKSAALKIQTSALTYLHRPRAKAPQALHRSRGSHAGL